MKHISLIFLSLFSGSSYALLFDFIDIKSANEAYENKNYPLAGQIYQKINNDFARLNAANSLYRQGLYEKALLQYQTLKAPSLGFASLHNIGNTYAQLGKIDEAIKAYKQALRIKNDTDTAFNLKLLKQQKQQQKDKKPSDKKDSKQNQDKKPSDKQDSKQDKNKKPSAEKNDKKQDEKDEKPSVQEDDKKQDKKDENPQSSKAGKPNPISKLEERRWEKRLKKGIRTLILPLKSNNNETNKPW